ncbi:hypothetical protein LP52_16165 [Streptomonospora alba]|uniref:Uncharacterized protein n=1 Tax=Streptomonospora alba TaxID=183763 RepID=A0A0C2J8Q0_9ACTN|nr:DUF6416 domain-containing protein [Streptomonospora alba]KIH97881.1 hypothetical protein LP52_16165 [Streptomonospora alba]
MTRIADDDPRWTRHDGGSGHYGAEWASDDHAAAVAYWDVLDGTGRRVHSYLFADPGRLIGCREIADQLGLDPEGTKNAANVVAGSLNGAGAASKAAKRSLPFRWWEKSGGAEYAVKHEVAALFHEAVEPGEA